jgi:hypothetical protein
MVRFQAISCSWVLLWFRCVVHGDAWRGDTVGFLESSWNPAILLRIRRNLNADEPGGGGLQCEAGRGEGGGGWISFIITQSAGSEGLINIEFSDSAPNPQGDCFYIRFGQEVIKAWNEQSVGKLIGTTAPARPLGGSRPYWLRSSSRIGLCLTTGQCGRCL